MQARLADAQAAAGDAAAARATRCSPRCARRRPADRLALTVALANQEWWLGGHEDARRRLQVALGELPAEPSPDRIRLRLALALTALMACDLDDARAQARRRDDARAIGDPVFEAAALAGGAMARVLAGDGRRRGRPRRVRGRARAPDAATQLATRLPAFWMHGRAPPRARPLRRCARRPRARRRDRRGAPAASASC